MTDTTSSQGLRGDANRTRSRWWTRAACRGTDVNVFFKPDKTESVSKAEVKRREAAAKTLCLGCPVADACLAEAVALRDRYAIRAAYAADERRHLDLL